MCHWQDKVLSIPLTRYFLHPKTNLELPKITWIIQNFEFVETNLVWVDVQQFSVFCLRKKYPNIDLLNRFQHLFPFFSVLKRPEWLFAALEIKIIFSQSILPPKRLMRLLSPQADFQKFSETSSSNWSLELLIFTLTRVV